MGFNSGFKGLNHPISPKLHIILHRRNKRIRLTIKGTELGPAERPNNSADGKRKSDREIYYRVADLHDSFPTPTHSTRRPVCPPPTLSHSSSLLESHTRCMVKFPGPAGPTQEIYKIDEEAGKMRKKDKIDTKKRDS